MLSTGSRMPPRSWLRLTCGGLLCEHRGQPLVGGLDSLFVGSCPHDLAAVRQVETPCTVFRHSMAFIGIAAGAMAFMHLMGMEPENWTKLILLSGFVGTALAAIHHQAAKTLFRRSDLRILKADAIETIPQPGVSPIVAIDDTAEFQNPDSRVVFTDRHLNPVQG